MTGLFFGSFNPIHKGHLAIAQYFLNEGYCGEVWFVVSPQNPCKEDRALLDEQKRLEIVRAAIARDGRMQACDIEFGMARPSYTFETLRLIKEKWPEKDFVLIIGEDNLHGFYKWRNAEKIAEICRILAYPRKGSASSSKTKWGSCLLVDAPLADVSSTKIREMLVRGEDISLYEPEEAVPLILKYYSMEK